MSTVRQQIGGYSLNIDGQAAGIGGDLLNVHGKTGKEYMSTVRR